MLNLRGYRVLLSNLETIKTRLQGLQFEELAGQTIEADPKMVTKPYLNDHH